MTKTVHGVVHGRTIEVEEDLGVAEGQRVELQIRIVAQRAEWGDCIRRSAGGLGWLSRNGFDHGNDPART